MPRRKQNTMMTIRISEDLLQECHEKADTLEISTSSWIRAVLRWALDDGKKAKRTNKKKKKKTVKAIKQG